MLHNPDPPPGFTRLRSGTVIPSEELGQLFGGGAKRANNTVRRVKLGDEVICFTANDLSPLQRVLDILYAENQYMREVIGTDEQGRLKLRMRANGTITLRPDADEQPRKRRRPRRTRDSFASEEERREYKRSLQRGYNRTYEAKKRGVRA